MSMIIQTVTFKSELSEEEIIQVMEERLPQFQALAGLVQKYYVKIPESGEWSGVYLWDSAASLAEYRESDLAKSIPAAYKVAGPPKIVIGEIIRPLRE